MKSHETVPAFETMTSLPEGYGAVVIGAGGAIGAALVRALENDPRAGPVLAFSRGSAPAVDVADEASLARASEHAAEALGPTAGARIVLVATGALTLDGRRPEKALGELDPEALARLFALNAVGPALALKHFRPLLPRAGKSLFAALSARVGSIGDNRLGGWYGYRASKAALNQLLRTASVEIARTRREAVLAALHPGTVESALSRPFRPRGAAAEGIFTPDQSAARLLTVLDGLTAAQTGGFFAYDGSAIPW